MNVAFLFKNRYSVLFSFVAVFIAASFLIRLGLVTATIEKTDFSFLAILRIFTQNPFYEPGTSVLLNSFFVLNLLPLSQRFIRLYLNILMSHSNLFPGSLFPIEKPTFISRKRAGKQQSRPFSGYLLKEAVANYQTTCGHFQKRRPASIIIVKLTHLQQPLFDEITIS